MDLVDNLMSHPIMSWGLKIDNFEQFHVEPEFLNEIPLFCALIDQLHLDQDGLHDGNHHGRSGVVRDPHGEEGRRDHEAQHEESGRGPDHAHRVEGEAPMQVALLDRDGHDNA